MRRWSLPRLPDLRLAAVAVVVWTVQALGALARGSVGHAAPATESLAPAWWRDAFTRVTTTLPGEGGQLLPGLTLGDTAGVTEGLNLAMRSASLSHLTAVSGANCAVVTAVVIAAAAALGLPRWARGLAGVVALAGFVLVVGLQPSVLRASVMALVVVVAMTQRRPHAGVPVLALSVIVLLLFFPDWAVSPGFTLSVVATASLLVVAPALIARLAPRLGNRWATVLAVPISAQLACQPIIVLLSPTWSTYGIAANIVAEPLAPLATILGMAAFILAPAVPAVAVGVAWCAWLPAQVIGSIAVMTQRLPFALLPWLSGLTGFVTALMSSVALGVLLLTTRRGIRLAMMPVIIVTLGSSLAVSLVSAASSRLTRPAEWTIAACDVGQGDALVVRGTDHQHVAHALLIDTGRHEEPLRTCLADLGVTTLDAVILTHFDMDHAGGVATVYGRTSRALISAPQREQDNWVVRDLAAHGVHVERARAGQRLDVGDARVDILWPRPDIIGMQGGNPGSISLLVQCHGKTAAFLADLGAEAQERLLTEYPALGSVDVLKVAHHGSADQSPRLTERLHPRIALISVGRDNGYGHPTARTLDLLRTLGARIDRTDREGLILVSFTGRELTVWSQKTDTGPD